MPLSRTELKVGYGRFYGTKEDHSRVVSEDRFNELLEAVKDSDQSGDALTNLAQRYSYVLPDDRSLTMLAALGSLVEMGAGTGYWSYRLRAIGVDIVAIDQAPPDGDRPNRYHAATPTWTDVIAGDHTALTAYSDRALFLCWPPLFSTLGDSLTYYSGNIVAIIGDGGHRTARLLGLNEAFSKVAMSPLRALEPLPGAAATLSIWRRSRQ
jgi:hypothetical protein